MEIFQQRIKGPRACSTCAKAKARCIPGPDASKCERCHRLNKQCPAQTPAPPRRRKEPKTTRVAELERRLEDLTSRIEIAQKQQQVPTPPASADSLVNTDAPISSSPSLEQFKPCQGMMGHLFPSALPDVDRQAPTGPIASPPCISDDVRQRTNSWNITNDIFTSSASTPLTDATPRPASVSVTTPGYASLWPSGEDADTLLTEYRTMEHLFPFVVIPPGQGCSQIRQQRPFLWKAIMMAACHLDGARQIALGNQLLKDISEAAYTKPQKSIDLLQGLQILISWFHYSLNSFQMTNLLYLGRSICVSLGLNEKGQGLMKETEHSSQCLEQMRAFAGTYYLVTVIFTTNKKTDPLMNTSYLEACCRILESRMEYQTDELLVWLVRVQQLSQSISLTLSFGSNASLLQTSDLPKTLIVKSLQQQIAAFRESVPPHIKANPSLVGHQYIGEILLYEIGLQENTGLPVTDRLGFLWACVRSTQAFFRNKFAAPFTDQPRFVAMCSFDFIYASLTVLKLVTLVLPGWDLKIIREELKFDELVDRQIEAMHQIADRRAKASSTRAEGGGVVSESLAQDPFKKLGEKLKMLRDVLCGQLDIGFNDNLAKAASAGAMTVTDATQGIVEDLEGSLWQSLMGAAADWESFDSIPFQGFVF